jgi:hypothetical protein
VSVEGAKNQSLDKLSGKQFSKLAEPRTLDSKVAKNVAKNKPKGGEL